MPVAMQREGEADSLIRRAPHFELRLSHVIDFLGLDGSPTDRRAEALAAAGRYAKEAFRAGPFVPGETPVPVAGRVIGAPEVVLIVRMLHPEALGRALFVSVDLDEILRACHRQHGFHPLLDA